MSLTLIAVLAAPLAAQTPAPAAPAAPVVRQKLPNDSVAIARKYASWIWSSQVDSLIAHMVPDTSAPNRQQITDQFARMSARVGTEAQLVEERWVRRNGERQYWRIARFTDFTDEPVALRIVIMPDGRMGGMGFNPLSRVPAVDPEP
jgi:hypothetical protein